LSPALHSFPTRRSSDLNFLQDDGLTDSDFDGTPNNVELKAHTDPRSADPKAQAELGYIYREVPLGIRPILFASTPRKVTGVTVDDLGPGSTVGNAQLSFAFAPDGKQILAWRDAAESEFGNGVPIGGDGQYTLTAKCTGQDPCQRSAKITVTTAILPPFPVDEFLRVASA